MANRYWVGGSATWDGTAGTKWALTSGGAGGQAVPTSADDVFLDAASGAVTVTLNASGNQQCNNLNFTGFTGTLALDSSFRLVFNGNLTLSATMTMSNVNGGMTYGASSGITGTITSNGKTFTGSLDLQGVGATASLADAFVISGNLIISYSTFLTNNFNVTCKSIDCSNGWARTLNLGSSTITVTDNGNAVNLSGTGITFIGTATISLTSSSAKNFVGGGYSLSGMTINQGGSGALTFTGSNTFKDITNSYSATGATTIKFTSGTTQTLTQFTATGAAAKVLTLGASTTSAATLTKTFPWYMGANSTDGGNNTGLTSTAGGGIDYLSISYINFVSNRSNNPLALQTSNTFAYTFPNSGNGQASYLLVPNHPVLNLSGGNWTVECWVKSVPIYTNWQTIFTKRGTGGTSYEGALQISTANTGAISYYNGTNYNSTNRPAQNTWSHLAWVFYNGANLTMYVNGTNVFTTTAVTSITDNDFPLAIGNIRTLNQAYIGQISNFRMIKGQAIYNGNFVISSTPFNLPNNTIGLSGTNVASSLTGNVVLLTAQNDSFKDNGNTILSVIPVGEVFATSIPTSELQTFSYFFPANSSGGNGSVIATNSTNSLNLNADFTMEMWYYPTVNSGTVLERGIGGVTNNTASYILAWDAPNNNLNFAVSNANNNTYCLGSVTGEAGSLGRPTLNAWNHIAVTRATNTWRGFLNGNLNLSVATNSNTPYFPANRGLTIGGQFSNGAAYGANTPTNTINGYISTLRIIRGNSIYNAAFTTPTSVLGNVTNAVLLTGITPALVDLTGTHAVAVNGMSTISTSTFSPFTANSVANTNAANVSFGTTAQGKRLIRIYNKFDYANFGQAVNIYPVVGRRIGRIYNKFDYANFGQAVNIYPAAGKRLGRIYDKLDTDEIAYMPYPITILQTANAQYQFWS